MKTVNGEQLKQDKTKLTTFLQILNVIIFAGVKRDSLAVIERRETEERNLKPIFGGNLTSIKSFSIRNVGALLVPKIRSFNIWPIGNLNCEE